MEKYTELLQAIISKQIIIVGSKVVTKRAAAAGVELDQTGKVTSFTGTGQEALTKLVAQFTDLSGPAGAMFCKQAMEPILKKYPDLKLTA